MFRVLVVTLAAVLFRDVFCKWSWLSLSTRRNGCLRPDILLCVNPTPAGWGRNEAPLPKISAHLQKSIKFSFSKRWDLTRFHHLLFINVLKLALTWHQTYMLFLPALLWSGLFAFYSIFNVSAAADVECMGVLVCLYVTGYVFVSSALQAGGSEWLGSFGTALIRTTHAHNRSNETESCGSCAYRPLCHILFVQAALQFLKQH